MIQSTPAERYPKVSYMRPEGTMEYYTDQTRPPTARRVCTRLLYGGRTHSLGGEGGGEVNILEDARHSSVLYICKYFVPHLEEGRLTLEVRLRM
jgi:hypothetical protein